MCLFFDRLAEAPHSHMRVGKRKSTHTMEKLTHLEVRQSS
jgi:hypothetical protein